MAGEGQVRSPGQRKRTLSGAGATSTARLARVHALSATARALAPHPQYLERLSKGAGCGDVPFITERQREKVVKYINELAEDFELLVQTGGLACNYFDRFVSSLSAEEVHRGKRPNIQMIASTCLLIASKFFDRKLPPLSELEKVHHGNARAEEFAALELRILSALNWKLHVPLPHVFIEHLKGLCVETAPFTPAVEDRMLFFIDLSVYGYRFLAFPPCAIAAASIVTAWRFSDEPSVAAQNLPMLARACELEPQELSVCINSLVRYYQVCFPDAAANAQPPLFVPIAPEGESRGVSPADSSASTEVDSVATAADVDGGSQAAPDEPAARQGGAAPSPMLCPSPSAGEMQGHMAESKAAANLKAGLPEEQTDRADTPDAGLTVNPIGVS